MSIELTSNEIIFNLIKFFAKVYVQELLKQNSEEIFDLVHNKKAHIYICGDIKMGADVTNNLEYVLMQKLNISELEAKDYLFDMKVNHMKS